MKVSFKYTIIIGIVAYCYWLMSLTGFAYTGNMQLFDKGLILDGEETKIELELCRHFILVKTKLARSPREYFFILDTGMKVNIINLKTLMEIDAKKVNEGVAIDTTGTSAKLETFEIASVRVGKCQVNNAIAAASDLTALSRLSGREISGIIGDNFLRQFKVCIDYQNRQILFSNPAERVSGGTIITMSEHPAYTPPIIAVTVDGKSIPSVVDTGASDISLPLDFLHRLDYPLGERISGKGSMSGGLLGTSKQDILARINNIAVGDITLQRYPVRSVRGQVALLGYKFLSEFKVIIDYPNNMISLQSYKVPQFSDNVFGSGLAASKK